MIICKVVGHVWATKKEESLDGSKLMVVEQTDTYGEANFKETFVAADVVGAGIGERVRREKHLAVMIFLSMQPL